MHDWLAKGLLDESVLSQDLRDGFRMENPPFEYIWPRVSFQGDRAIHYLRGKDAFTDYLADAGYECGLSGKWHMGDSFTPRPGLPIGAPRPTAAKTICSPLCWKTAK